MSVERATELVAKSFPGWTQRPAPGPRGNLDREVNAECLRQARRIVMLLAGAGMLASSDAEVRVPQRVHARAKDAGEAVWVGVRSVWANPFGSPRGMATQTREILVDDYREWLTTPVTKWPGRPAFSAAGRTSIMGVPFEGRPDPAALAGRDLACSCPLSQPCHADVLLELANARA